MSGIIQSQSRLSEGQEGQMSDVLFIPDCPRLAAPPTEWLSTTRTRWPHRTGTAASRWPTVSWGRESTPGRLEVSGFSSVREATWSAQFSPAGPTNLCIEMFTLNTHTHQSKNFSIKYSETAIFPRSSPACHTALCRLYFFNLVTSGHPTCWRKNGTTRSNLREKSVRTPTWSSSSGKEESWQSLKIWSRIWNLWFLRLRKKVTLRTLRTLKMKVVLRLIRTPHRPMGSTDSSQWVRARNQW